MLPYPLLNRIIIHQFYYENQQNAQHERLRGDRNANIEFKLGNIDGQRGAGRNEQEDLVEGIKIEIEYDEKQGQEEHPVYLPVNQITIEPDKDGAQDIKDSDPLI
jgi:hypothetical protein